MVGERGFEPPIPAPNEVLYQAEPLPDMEKTSRDDAMQFRRLNHLPDEEEKRAKVRLYQSVRSPKRGHCGGKCP